MLFLSAGDNGGAKAKAKWMNFFNTYDILG
jgi:hypothetical protein